MLVDVVYFIRYNARKREHSLCLTGEAWGGSHLPVDHQLMCGLEV